MSFIKITFFSIISFGIGLFLFFIHNNKIIIIQKPQDVPIPVKMQKTIPFYYAVDDILKKEDHPIIWDTEPEHTIQTIVTEWFHFMHQEGYVPKKIYAKSVAYNPKRNEIYIDLSDFPFGKNHSTAKKILFIESLFKTISVVPGITTIMLLCDEKPLIDPHLDFSYPWPIDGYNNENFGLKQIAHPPHAVTPFDNAIAYTIFIIPSGDTAHKGRTLDHDFERTITTQLAQKIKDAMAIENQHVKVVVLKTAHETLTAYQRATRANQKNNTLVISLNAYQNHSEGSACAIYYYVRNAITDRMYKKPTLALEPYDYAHRVSLSESYTYAMRIMQTLTKSINCSCLGIPYTPLRGIIKPALAFEFGIHTSSEIPALAQLCTHALLHALFFQKE